MQKIRNLIHADLITMNGGKNSMRLAFVLLFVFVGVFGFLFSPLFGLYCPLLMSGFFVPMLFQNETKYHSEKMYSLLPIGRRDLVQARFLLTVGLYTVLYLVFYLIMLVSLWLKPYYLMMGEDAEMMDIIKLIAKNSYGSLSEFGVFNLLYFAVYSIGLMFIASALRKRFKSNDKDRGNALDGTIIRKASKEEIALGLTVLGIILVWILIVTDVLPITSAVMPVLQLLMQLAQAANGFLLVAVMVAIAAFSAVYKYICTVLEYDDKEL